MQPDHVWSHVTDDQGAGRACVMCGRPTDEPGWAGVVVGRSDGGSPVYACSGGDGADLDVRGDRRASGRDCAEQAAVVVPDSPEGLEL
jgi:hypothetical protein